MNDDIHIIFHPIEEGGYWVDSPQIQGLTTQGDSIEECLKMTLDAYQLLIEPWFTGYHITGVLNPKSYRPKFGPNDEYDSPTSIALTLQASNKECSENKTIDPIWHKAFSDTIKKIVTDPNNCTPFRTEMGLHTDTIYPRLYITITPDQLNEIVPELNMLIAKVNDLYQAEVQRKYEKEDMREEIIEDFQENLMNIKF